jgi:GNAT superfamily N-acetyltransferase
MQIVNLKDELNHLVTLASWHHDEWSYLNPDATLEERIEEMKRCLGPEFIPTTYIAKDDELLGSAAIVEHDMDTKQELSPWLASVYVAPQFRRKGVGSKLVLHVMNQARENGVEALYLFTPDEEEFYAHLGWKPFEKTKYRGYAVTIMKVNLQPKR